MKKEKDTITLGIIKVGNREKKEPGTIVIGGIEYGPEDDIPARGFKSKEEEEEFIQGCIDRMVKMMKKDYIPSTRQKYKS